MKYVSSAPTFPEHNHRSELTIDESRLEDFFIDTYYDRDGSHGINHIKEVYDLAKKMVEKLNLNIGQDELIIACYCHDMFSKTDRERHHILAEDFIWDNRGELWFLKDLDNDAVIRIARAVAQHRASYTEHYSSILSEVLSAADRGKLSAGDTIRRSFKFTIENNPDMKVQDAIALVYIHMKEKFGSNGYARYNDVFKNYFFEELGNYQRYIDQVGLFEIEDIIINSIKYGKRSEINKLFSIKV